MSSKIRRAAFIGNYVPRQCGIATFTTDLAEAVARALPDAHVMAVPINDTEEGYAYPPRVRFEISEREVGSYLRAADFLNVNNVDVVYLQHEFGIFGGPAGSHILALLKELRMPIITTLHTVLKEPSANVKRVTEELAEVSDRLVVMSSKAFEFLEEVYSIPMDKVDFIHHGIPDVPFVDPSFYKDQFGVDGKKVLLTFGLLSPDKGIEYAIEALPKVLKKHPDVVYIVLGKTHPHLLKHDGESYRLSLQQRAKSLGVEANVLFHNRFVGIEELCEFIGATDVYLTPYLKEAQITSGTLAYTLGAGKAIVGTPYWYAQELLDEERGLLVPFKDSEAFADAIIYLLDNEQERHAMRKRAYLYGRNMVWATVAQKYVESYEKAREFRTVQPKPTYTASTLDRRSRDLPPLKLIHIKRLTDTTGLIQHAKFCVPDYNHGYATDDNGRALVLTVFLEETAETLAREVRELASRYLAFLNNAFNEETGRFRTFMGYDRRWVRGVGTEDAHGRALWGLGTVAGRSRERLMRQLASRLFDSALPATVDFSSPRAWAYTIFGIQMYLRRFYGHRAAQEVRETLSNRLMELYKVNATDDWCWFEDRLTYCNAVLPHALMLSGQWLDNGEMVEVALSALQWLTKQQKMESDHFVPIGSEGFHIKGKERARFDQQPIEAYVTVSACLQAHRLTGDDTWKKEADRAFEWFLGANDLGAIMFDPSTGGCFDGLEPDGVNQNQGAESTLAFLLARVEMEMAEHVISVADADS